MLGLGVDGLGVDLVFLEGVACLGVFMGLGILGLGVLLGVLARVSNFCTSMFTGFCSSGNVGCGLVLGGCGGV